MSIPLEQVSLDLLDEGRFVQDVNTRMADMSHAMLDFVRRYGGKAKKGKGVVKVEIGFIATDPESDKFDIETSIKLAMPSAPKKSTWAVTDVDPETGEESLFVRGTGSTRDNPRQQVLCTEDGRTVVDGEVVEESKPPGKKKS